MDETAMSFIFGNALTHITGTDIATAITTVVGSTAAILAARHQRKTSDRANEAHKDVAVLESYTSLVHDLQSEVSRIRQQYEQEQVEYEKIKLHNKALEENNEELEEENLRLKHQLAMLKGGKFNG